MNLYSFTDNNKRYYTLNYFNRQHFKQKVVKISLNGGFTCPNIDGKVGYKGCIYCSSLGSGDFAGKQTDSLKKQFEDVKKVIDKKWPNSKYIAYFQAHSNTYAPLDVLKGKYESVLKFDDVIGLALATRPDCIDEDILNYLEDLSKRTYLTVELGLQTIHKKTSILINRCHTLKCFDDCVKNLRKRNINVVVHIINGLPYETKDMMIETVKHLNSLDIQGIKIHMLHILKNTVLAKMYLENNFHILSKEEYVNIVCDELEYLNPNIVVHRITGDPNVSDLIAPTWLTKKLTVLNDIDKELAKRLTYQGFKKSILNEVKRQIILTVREKDIVIDATVGNGNDTLFLASLVPKGKVIGYDIQKKAIDNTKNLVKNFSNVTLFNESHENIYKLNLKNKVSLILFNLGYLPGGNKDITTKSSSTLKAIKHSLKLLNNKGKILIVFYSHKEGKKEANTILNYLKKHDYNYEIKRNTDNINAPYLLILKKPRI